VELSRSILFALIVSIAVHALLAVGLVAYLEYAPGPEVVATLDLTSVELSFAEKVEESASVTPVPPSPPPEPEPPRPKEGTSPLAPHLSPLAPDPLAPKFPEPEEAKPEVKTSVPADSQPQTSNLKPQTAAPAAPRQARVDAPPSPKRSIRPDYPKGARQRGEQGAVVLEIQVDAKGAVSGTKVVVSSGFAELDEAAVKAARKAKFRPAKSGNKSVASTARLKLDFKLK